MKYFVIVIDYLLLLIRNEDQNTFQCVSETFYSILGIELSNLPIIGEMIRIRVSREFCSLFKIHSLYNNGKYIIMKAIIKKVLNFNNIEVNDDLMMILKAKRFIDEQILN
jgi:hypothetical protein